MDLCILMGDVEIKIVKYNHQDRAKNVFQDIFIKRIVIYVNWNIQTTVLNIYNPNVMYAHTNISLLKVQDVKNLFKGAGNRF